MKAEPDSRVVKGEASISLFSAVSQSLDVSYGLLELQAKMSPSLSTTSKPEGKSRSRCKREGLLTASLSQN
jgi:hypothetical protein